MLEPKFHKSNSKTKICYNVTFILPDFMIFMQQIIKQVKTWLVYIYGHAKTMLEEKFHASNSQNKNLPFNGTFILPDIEIFIQ